MSQLGPFETESDVRRRRVPRRNFSAVVGVLCHGQQHVARAYQVGEGGMMISSVLPLQVGWQVVVSFFIRGDGLLILVRGTVRSVVPPYANHPVRYGLEFANLGFQYKREIRNFVAAASNNWGAQKVAG